MLKTFNHHFQLPMYIIHPGEHFLLDKSGIISTVLGSCISVVLHDEDLKLSGMNHFMLPGHLGTNPIFQNDAGRYGIYAMETLVNSMIKLGASRQRLVAKIFGGGHVLAFETKGREGIPESNIRFAFEYLTTEKIPIVSSDTGGIFGRKILLFSENNKVLLKRLTGSRAQETSEQEELYLRTLEKGRRYGSITFFPES